MKPNLHVIKIGGNIIDNVEELNVFLNHFSSLEGFKILVHGGGKIATKISDKIGIKSKLIDGRRITSDEDLEVVTMVYAGLINKNIVANLQASSCNALGLSGADGNAITSIKRIHKTVDFGNVGDISAVNKHFILSLLKQDITPIFSAITHDGNGRLLNTNADTIASEIAIAMSEDYDVKLIYCFEKKGVLQNKNDDNSVIEVINSEKYESLRKNNTINEGMLPKLNNCFHALHKNVASVIIGSTTIIEHSNAIHTTLEI